jgi:hypothetical protein
MSCFGRTPKVLRELLGECRAQYLELIQNKISVFENQGDSWKRSVVRDIISMSTVTLDERVTDKLLKDIGDFLNPTTRRWYSDRGFPYRRGLLSLASIDGVASQEGRVLIMTTNTIVELWLTFPTHKIFRRYYILFVSGHTFVYRA